MVVMPANARANYSKCVEAANPAQCIARRAVDSSRLDPESAIPALALGLWIDAVGYSGSSPRFLLTHEGLPAIWDRAVRAFKNQR